MLAPHHQRWKEACQTSHTGPLQNILDKRQDISHRFSQARVKTLETTSVLRHFPDPGTLLLDSDDDEDD